MEAPEKSTGVVSYLPHQVVIREDKDKIRPVYNGSSRPHRLALSLNDCIYRGPVLLKQAAGILLRSRLFPHIVLCDIEGAFLQVQLHPNDRDCTRFFWTEDPKILT